MKSIFQKYLFFIGLLLLWASASASFAFEKNSLSFTKRIVSLDLCSDALLKAAAPNDTAITLSPWSKRYPDLINRLSTQDSKNQYHDGSLESIIHIQPHLIIVNAFNATLLTKRLQALGFNVVVTPLAQNIEQIESIKQQLKPWLTLDSWQRQPPTFKQKGRLLLLGANGYATGTNTLENDIIEQAGWTNYIQQTGHIRLNIEKLVVDPPEAIIILDRSSPAWAQQFQQHPALQKALLSSRQIKTDTWRWQCAGPWMNLLIKQLQLKKQFF